MALRCIKHYRSPLLAVVPEGIVVTAVICRYGSVIYSKSLRKVTVPMPMQHIIDKPELLIVWMQLMLSGDSGQVHRSCYNRSCLGQLITLNKELTFNALDSADGMLKGTSVARSV